MSGDEYDDESSDDELEKNLKSPANEALERLRARKRPTKEDVKLGEPFYEKLANQERVPFLFVRDSFFLGSECLINPSLIRPNLRGYGYLRRVCQNSERTHRLDRYISAFELDSEGVVGAGGMLYSPDPQAYAESHDDDDGYDWETTNQQSAFECVIERTDMRVYAAEVKRLEGQGETVETSELLKFYKEQLGQDTHQGNIKNADREEEKVRQRVWHAFEAAYEDMEGKDTGTEELRFIAADFRKHLIRGRRCIYTGPLKFRFS